jgi:hypothetical protein
MHFKPLRLPQRYPDFHAETCGLSERLPCIKLQPDESDFIRTFKLQLRHRDASTCHHRSFTILCILIRLPMKLEPMAGKAARVGTRNDIDIPEQAGSLSAEMQ